MTEREALIARAQQQAHELDYTAFVGFTGSTIRELIAALTAEVTQREAAERERDEARKQRNAFDRECKRLRAALRADLDAPHRPSHTCHVSGDTCAGCDYALMRDQRIVAAEAQATAAREALDRVQRERDLYSAAWTENISAADMDAFAARFRRP